MADVKLTKDQQSVVDARDCSLLVAAAAGSGKTAVLVKRIIDRLTNPDKPARLDKLLIVTFTKAAAAEMRERIGKALEKAMEERPEDENLGRQLAMLPAAQISTIDSFCMSVVKENYHSLSIDPGFVIADEGELDLVADDVLTELLEEEYENDTEAFRRLLSAYTSHKDDSTIKQYVMNLYRFADSDPRPEEWLKRAEESFSKSISETDMPDAILHDAKRTIADCRRLCSRAEAVCRAEKGPARSLEVFLSDGDMMDRFLACGSFQQLQECFSSEMVFVRYNGPSKKQFESGECLEELAEEVKGIRERYKKTLQALQAAYFAMSLRKTDEIYFKCAPAMLELIRLTKEFMLRFAAVKAERNSYGFSDVAHFAHCILCRLGENGEELPSEVAAALSKRYDEIMIDEYQDSSFLQEYTLRAVSGEFSDAPNLFMVGDVKQSIYGFRKARPELFNNKYNTFERTGKYRKIDLDMNFRSRKCVLDSINVLLSSIMRRDISEIEYDEHAALHFGSNNYTDDTPNYSTELLLIDKDADENELESASEIMDFYERLNSSKDEKLTAAKTSAIEREALCVGLKIKELVSSGFPVSAGSVDGVPQTRPVTYGDFAVLTRSVKGVTEVFTKVFTKLRIPSSAETGTGFFESVEVQKVLAFLHILDNPYQDIPFAAVLYSPFVGFSAEELAEIYVAFGKYSGKKGSLYECAKRAADAGNDKLVRFFEMYETVLEISEYSTVHEVLEELYSRSGYMDIVAVQPQGDRRSGNLERLITIAKTFEKSSFTGVHDFIRYVDRLIENDKDFGEATTDTTEGCVRIMSIHKSKGLEFPIVFLCRMGTKFNTRDITGNLIFDQDYGIGSNYIDVDLRTKQKTLKQGFLQNKKKRADKSEEVRVLYVALTRAKEKLFMVGTVDKSDKKFAEMLLNWSKALVDGQMTFSDIDKAENYLDMVGPALFDGCTADELKDFTGNGIVRTITGVCGAEQFSSEVRLTHIHFDEEKAFNMLEGIEEPAEKETEVTVGSFMDIPGIKEAIEAREHFVYPYLERAMAPSKVSVSELKMIAMHDMEEEKATEILPVTQADDEMPEDTGKKYKGATGAERGTLYHEVLEKLRYTGDYSTKEKAAESLKAELAALISEGYLPEDIQDTVTLPKLTAFCMSSIGQRMISAWKSHSLYREQAFVYGLSNDEYKQFSRDNRDTETVMLQGIIDAYIDEPDGLVLIDYKTDKVAADAAKELTERYSVQLELYGKALSRLRRKPVKEKVIYSVAKNQVILLP